MPEFYLFARKILFAIFFGGGVALVSYAYDITTLLEPYTLVSQSRVK